MRVTYSRPYSQRYKRYITLTTVDGLRGHRTVCAWQRQQCTEHAVAGLRGELFGELRFTVGSDVRRRFSDARRLASSSFDSPSACRSRWPTDRAAAASVRGRRASCTLR